MQKINSWRRDPLAALASLALTGTLVCVSVGAGVGAAVSVACPGWIQGTDHSHIGPAQVVISAPAPASDGTPAVWTATTSPSERPATLPRNPAIQNNATVA